MLVSNDEYVRSQKSVSKMCESYLCVFVCINVCKKQQHFKPVTFLDICYL